MQLGRKSDSISIRFIIFTQNMPQDQYTIQHVRNNLLTGDCLVDG